MLEPPDTFNEFVLMRWLLENQHQLYIRAMLPKLAPANPAESPRYTLVDLKSLTPQTWIYHAERLFYDRKHQVWPKDRWEKWEAQRAAEAEAF